MVADSGCQSSIILLRSALAMGINKADVIPVKLTMCGAIKEDLGVEGGIIARACTSDAIGANRSTKLMIYVLATMEKVFLCREALISLGASHANFPELPVSWLQDFTASLESSEPPTCHCPTRGQEPPPYPQSCHLICQPQDENVAALKEWLLDYCVARPSMYVSINHDKI